MSAPSVTPLQVPADVAPPCVGTVRWYSSEKGYGFILGDDGSDLFVRYSDITMEGFKALTDGQRVSFDVGDDGLGPVALDVRPL